MRSSTEITPPVVFILCVVRFENPYLFDRRFPEDFVIYINGGRSTTIGTVLFSSCEAGFFSSARIVQSLWSDLWFAWIPSFLCIETILSDIRGTLGWSQKIKAKQEKKNVNVFRFLQSSLSSSYPDHATSVWCARDLACLRRGHRVYVPGHIDKLHWIRYVCCWTNGSSWGIVVFFPRSYRIRTSHKTSELWTVRFFFYNCRETCETNETSSKNLTWPTLKTVVFYRYFTVYNGFWKVFHLLRLDNGW